MEMKKIFVYGTLRKGFGLNNYMDNFKYLGVGKLKGFDMFSNGYFPMIIKGSGEVVGEVVGEVYEIENGINEIGVLDKIESAYTRTKVRVKLNGVLTDVEVYVYNGDVTSFTQIKSGNWILRI